MPREPSTPRIAVWRKLKALGAAKLTDGLVALPDSPESREQLDWLAIRVTEASGQAVVWAATAVSEQDSRNLVEQMRAACDDDYQALLDEMASASEAPDKRTLARWRREWRRIRNRDHFGAKKHDLVEVAIRNAAAHDAAPTIKAQR